MSEVGSGEPARTLLARMIRERNLSLEEFAGYAERFAREHGQDATLSARHLQRLVSGRGENGRPLGRPRPATVRLLELIFDVEVDRLLSPPADDPAERETELRRMLGASGRLSADVLVLLRDQLDGIRRLDRQLGTRLVHDEVLTKITQLERVLGVNVDTHERRHLAGLLSELSTLAGWQALDSGQPAGAWEHYARGRAAAEQHGDPAFTVLSEAGQAFTLVELGEPVRAVELLSATRERAEAGTSRLMRSWIAAAHGEVLAANGNRDGCLRAFDHAGAIHPGTLAETDGPYVVLDDVHLTRWRGHALARTGEPEALDVLTSALSRLDPTFTRVEAGLRVDLETAFTAVHELEARGTIHAGPATLAAEIGSARQRRRDCGTMGCPGD